MSGMAGQIKQSTPAAIESRFSEAILGSHSQKGDETVIIKKDSIFSILKFLKEDPDQDYAFLMDLTAVDYPDRDLRFEVVYHLYSMKRNARIRLKTGVSVSDPRIESCVPLYRGASWYERECYDMYGIIFENHPDLRRILLYEEFQGHPLRKDYPVNKRQPLVGPEN